MCVLIQAVLTSRTCHVHDSCCHFHERFVSGLQARSEGAFCVLHLLLFLLPLLLLELDLPQLLLVLSHLVPLLAAERATRRYDLRNSDITIVLCDSLIDFFQKFLFLFVSKQDALVTHSG